MKTKRWVIIPILCIFLAGCTTAAPVSKPARLTLPPPQPETAPAGDALQEFAETVQLHVPDSLGSQLTVISEKILMPQNRHPADETVRKLLSFTGNDAAQPLSQETPLQLATGTMVEISGDVATVDLAATALMLDARKLYFVSRAIANTLTQWGDIRYVNILVLGRQHGIDTASAFPGGCFQQTRNDDVTALWENAVAQAASAAESAQDKRFSSVAALYFPAAAGRGILAEARSLSFQGQTPVQMASALIGALSLGAQTLPGVPAVPDLTRLLAEAPALHTLPGSDQRVITLRFLDDTNEALISAGIPRSVMMAALTCTLTTFIPGIAGIRVHIGSEAIQAVVPAGIYAGAGDTILFEDGVMRRSDFAAFILTYSALYLANSAGGLTKTLRPIPYQQVYNARYLLNQLMEGPQVCDSVQALSAALPEGLKDADILGIARDKDRLLVNLSGALLEKSKGMNALQEKLMVYSIVNTLTAMRGVRRVSFFINGEQPDTFAGSLYLPGEFLYNPEIVHAPQ